MSPGQTQKQGLGSMKIVKLLGLIICIGIVFGAVYQVGPALYFDISSILFVFGGAAGFVLMKIGSEKSIQDFGNGAVYFGWLGTLIGLIAITGNQIPIFEGIEQIGPALAVAMNTLFYGYIVRLITLALTKD